MCVPTLYLGLGAKTTETPLLANFYYENTDLHGAVQSEPLIRGTRL